MTTLPIPIPSDYSLVVKKGDHVEVDDILAKPSEVPQAVDNEVIIELVAIFNESPNSVRKYLKKGPGDSVREGEVIASRSTSLGLKIDKIVAHVNGTIIRFERDTGKLVIKNMDMPPEPKESLKNIVSPIAGTIKVCNNDSIVITPDGKSDKAVAKKEDDDKGTELPKIKAGEIGWGGTAKGQLLVLSPKQDAATIASADLTPDTIGKILLLPDIDKEAIAKASAMGVAGILGTDLLEDIFSYVKSRKIDLPIISIDQGTGKKLVKSKKDIIMNGKDKTVTNED